MKKVCVFECSIPDFLNESDAKKTLELWLATDEGKFCVKESKIKLEIVSDLDYAYYNKRIRIFAKFDEKIETFWRLKFK
jgi:hypothetical protein